MFSYKKFEELLSKNNITAYSVSIGLFLDSVAERGLKIGQKAKKHDLRGW